MWRKGGHRVLHYAMYFSEEEAVSLREKFEKLGFIVNVNKNAFGDEYDNSHLISIHW